MVLYSKTAIQSSRQNAAEWLQNNDEGFPRTWAQEGSRGLSLYELYEPDFQAPPIAGYESLEADGYVECLGEVDINGQRRKRYRITAAGRKALEESE